jgi:hypothetical protein
LPRLRDAGPFQVDPSGTGTSEEPDAVAEQNGREVDDGLVDEPFSSMHCRTTLAPITTTFFPSAAARACSTPSMTKVNGASSLTISTARRGRR